MQTDFQVLRKLQKRRSEWGLTLMESLVAILMISAVMVAITPPIFLAVATRVQNRRAEQAVQLAHGQIDQVRVLMEQGVANEKQLPKKVEGNIANVPALQNIHDDLQSTNFNCSTYDKNYNPQNPTQLDGTTGLPTDINGDCNPDFLVQIFRTNDRTLPDNDIPIVFLMGVRVYSIVAKDNIGNLKTSRASLQLTMGNGQQNQYPLSVMYTTLSRSDVSGSLDLYRSFKSED
jgi:type II secretory pathway pseudopilin PulG